ncbi:MAG TPA: amidohydrolase family protein, partial [Candidatus Limnocylindrales bacterium]|nr:amidohydrolase family protein [Candidatus Limnocylindrales bacterium]
DLHALGITTIHEMVRLPEEADDFAVLREIGQLDLRVRFYYRIHETPIAIDWFEGLGIRRGLGDDWLRVLGVKISIDGWCIVRNAAVEEPYFGEPDNRGLLRIDQECLSELVGRADRQGLGIALHAVGPRAVDAALDAFAASAPLRAGPHRIEHAHLDLDRSRLRRMRELGIVWSAQPALLTTYVRDWERALGPDRTERVLRLRDGLEVGVPIVLDSDLPSGPAGPLRAIRAAVDRSAGDRRVGADQAIDLVTAWRAHTTVPAELAGDGRLGRLATGYRADLVVLDSDPFADPTPAGTTTLDETRVVATMIDGRFVHGPWST